MRRAAPSWARKKADDEFTDALIDALPHFIEGRKRAFLRGAVENAQRLALAQYKPIAIAVEAEDLIHRAWASFFRQYLKGRFADEYKETKTEEELTRAAVVERGRRVRTQNPDAY